MSRKNFSTNAFLIGLFIFSCGTYIENVLFYFLSYCLYRTYVKYLFSYVPSYCLYGTYVEKTIVYVPFFSHDRM